MPVSPTWVGMPRRAQATAAPCRWRTVPVTVLERFVAVLRRGDVLPPVVPPRDVDPGALTTRSALPDLAGAVPGLGEELVDRARTAGLLVSWLAVIAMAAWTVVDRLTVPAQAPTFLVVRLLADVPMLLAVFALWRLPLGRRRPELLTFAVLAVVQIEIAWMITRTSGAPFHLLGFTLAIYGSGCIVVARPRWTVALVGVSALALAGFGLTAPTPMTATDLVAVGIFVGTASVIAILAHLRRYALSKRELTTRIRLEREQQRTGVLLAELERLSLEDPLTGLANRRRWDAALTSVCTAARHRAGVAAVVLLDIDHFKAVNDRHGHAGGDEVLRQVAGLLSARVRGADLVARVGGDEFAVLMPGADLDRAVERAERLRVETSELRPAGFLPGELSVSLGVAAVAGDQAYPVELMSRSDEQLYRAKITRNAVGASQRPVGVPAG
jgi:diguanylate cyclase (GGDEF)-like protein